MRKSSAGISIALHVSAIALLILTGARVAHQLTVPKVRIITVPLTFPTRHSAPGGGGANDALPPSRGRLPPRPASRVFVPPMIAVSYPKLPVSAAMIDAPAIQIPADQFGDPLGRAGIPSGGPGRRGGIGDGCCGGDGPGHRPGYGGDSQAAPVIAKVRYSTPPRLLYKIEPEYPDEARKARYEGTVVLNVEIDPAGRPRRLRVLRGLGLGMDERALEAVEKWRFAPALDSGRPVAAPVIVEVSFRLL
jgi:TonB family protein